MSDLPKRVKIKEVGPREGFQFEKGAISLADKIALVDAMIAAGQLAERVAGHELPGKLKSGGNLQKYRARAQG